MMRDKNGRYIKGHPQSNTGRTHLTAAQSTGPNHHLWKETNYHYNTIHGWIYRHRGKATRCSNADCVYPNPKRYEWANVSGKYLRDVNDYVELCPSCHRKWDMGIITIENWLVLI